MALVVGVVVVVAVVVVVVVVVVLVVVVVAVVVVVLVIALGVVVHTVRDIDPREPPNMSVLVDIDTRHLPQRVRENDIAP